MSITKKQLADQVLDKSRSGEILYCPSCGAEYSASAGDYWNLADDHVFTCNDCKVEMELVRKETRHMPVEL